MNRRRLAGRRVAGQQGLDQLPGLLRAAHCRGLVGVDRDDQEPVVGAACHQIDRLIPLAQPLADLAEHLIAPAGTVIRFQTLEAVEMIERGHQGVGLLKSFRAPAAQLGFQTGAVEQSG